MAKAVTNKFSLKTKTHIEYAAWLIFDDTGAIEIRRQKPSVKANERVTALTLKAPLTLWEKPEMSVVIELDDKMDGKATLVKATGLLEDAGFVVTVAPAGAVFVNPDGEKEPRDP